MIESNEFQKHHILLKSSQEANAITKESIEHALVLLMEEKNFSDISIKDITERAGVSRSSYYRNYDSKEDILSAFIQSINKELSTAMLQYDAVTETEKVWDALLTTIIPLAPKFKLLLEAGFGEKLTLEFASLMNTAVPADNSRLRYSNVYWAGAISAVLAEWIRNDMNTPKEVIAEIGTKLMVEGIHTVTEFNNHCD